MITRKITRRNCVLFTFTREDYTSCFLSIKAKWCCRKKQEIGVHTFPFAQNIVKRKHETQRNNVK